jgi:hypothetical protein
VPEENAPASGTNLEMAVHAVYGRGDDLLFFSAKPTAGYTSSFFHLWGEVDGTPVDESIEMGQYAMYYSYAAFDEAGEVHVAHFKDTDWNTMYYTRHAPGASSWISTNIGNIALMHKTLVKTGATLQLLGVDSGTGSIYLNPNLAAGTGFTDTGKKSEYNVLGAALGSTVYLAYNSTDSPDVPLVVSSVSGTPVVLEFTNSSFSNTYAKQMVAHGGRLYILGAAKKGEDPYIPCYWIFTPPLQQECHVLGAGPYYDAIAVRDGEVCLIGRKDDKPTLWVGTNAYGLLGPSGFENFYEMKLFLRYKD